MLVCQTIYSSILNNTSQHEFEFQDPQEMRSVEPDESEEVMPSREPAVRVSQSVDIVVDDVPATEGSGTNSLHKSVSVADLCSDLSNIM